MMRFEKSRSAIILLISCFAGASTVTAQEKPIWGPVVGFPNGTVVQTGIGTIPSGAREIAVSNTAVATAASTSPELGVFRRILKMADGRAIIYVMEVKRLEEGKQFEVMVRQWTPTPDEAQDMDIDPARVETEFLGHYSAPLVVHNGATLALDVLINPRTGVKLVDYFRITSRAPVPAGAGGNLASKARAIEIRDIEFFVQTFELWLNGKLIHTNGGGMSGRFIWLDVPQNGRFIFSLTPLSEVDGFHRVAYLTRNQIVFNNGQDKYELTSENPIVPAAGTFWLWMRLDPTFTFPARLSNKAGSYFSIGAADDLPLQIRE